MAVKMYLVGGAVRDELLGLQTKDLDYSVEAGSYQEMRDYIATNGTIFLEKPEYFTIRAKVNGKDADFVLCRKDGAYFDGRHPESVEPGTLLDDLKRRDFTMNAMAKDEDGKLIDPFNGELDTYSRCIRCVGNPYERFEEDALRLIRALRFVVTKTTTEHPAWIHYETAKCLHHPGLLQPIAETIPVERIREELHKMLKHNTKWTLMLLADFPLMRDAIFFRKELWLKPTTEQ